MISTLDTKEYYKLIELAEAVKLGEAVNFKCTFLVVKDQDGKILGMSGTRLDYAIPRFTHIVVREEHQKTSLAYRIMLATEKLVKERGHDVYTALIPNNDERMRGYAIKFGFKEYKESKDKMWFYKQL